VHKTATTDDKRLQSTLKRLGVNTIPGIEEVNIFQGDSVIHFVNPKGMHGGGGGAATGWTCWAHGRRHAAAFGEAGRHLEPSEPTEIPCLGKGKL
jgi:hypothetical protein